MYGLEPTTCPHLTQMREVLLKVWYFIDDISKILDFLFLGGYLQARDIRLLKDKGVIHVINCAAGDVETGKDFYDDSITYMEFEGKDLGDYNIMQHFDEVYKFIEEARTSGGKVFIHCIAGMNRSGALTVAYCMEHLNMGPVEAAKLVKAIRPQILLNDEFRKQLIDFAKEKGFIPSE